MDELQPIQAASPAAIKPARKGIAWVYLCGSELQRLQCSVIEPGPLACRVGCPFLQKRKPGQGLKREKYVQLEKRLVDFGTRRAEIILKWSDKARTMENSGMPDDAFIMGKIVDAISEPAPQTAGKLLTDLIRRCKLPLFRNYYKQARDDIAMLRKIQKQHERARKLKLKREAIESARRLSTGETLDGVLPKDGVGEERANGTVEGVPPQEVAGD